MGRAPSDTPASFWNYLLLILIILVSAFPLYWMSVVGTSTNEELAKIPPNLVWKDGFGENLDKVMNTQNAHFLNSMLNSAVVSVVVTISVLFFCSLAGFAFAKLRFRGRNALMVILIATMTIPSQLGVVALFILMAKIGWNQSLLAVIVPGLVTAFGVFYMRQFIEDAIPDELIEAARVDGATTFGTYWHIVLPVLRPAFGVLGLLTFVATWNDFQWPLITLQGGNTLTVQVALSNLASGVIVDYARVLCGALLATLPLLVIFFVAGKQIVTGIMEGAVKS
jgi:cellobiose transport system permease protein